MGKKFWLACIAVLVVEEVVNFLIHGVLLMTDYQATAGLWRVDMMRLMWIYHVIMVVGAFFFTFIFAYGHEGKGIMEGLRYGLYIGVWMNMGMAYGTYAMISIPLGMAVKWFIFGIVQYLLMGIAAAAVFGKKKAT